MIVLLMVLVVDNVNVEVCLEEIMNVGDGGVGQVEALFFTMSVHFFICSTIAIVSVQG